MPKLISLIGKKYGRLLVINRVSNKGKKVAWNCLCDCGNTHIAIGTDLKTNNTLSCGCIRIETAKAKATTHGYSKSKLYNSWIAMKSRCYNKKNKNYNLYGGEGVTVTEEWLNDFECFKKWALNNDYKENLTIDRIKGIKLYSPNTCRWVNMTIQNRNKRKQINTSSKYIGVQWNKQKRKWTSIITINKITKYLGIFSTELEAAKCRDNYIKLNKLKGFRLNDFK